jgi:hypothetical protein
LLTAATFDFGKVDGIGHLLVITVLLIVIADPGQQHPGCRPVLAPFVSSAAWLATILFYTGVHALYYRLQGSALLSLAGGAAALGLIFFCIQGRLPVLSRTTGRRRPFRDIPSGRAGETHGEGARARLNWPEVAQEPSRNTAPGFAGVVLRSAMDRYRDGAAWSEIFSGHTRTQTD